MLEMLGILMLTIALVAVVSIIALMTNHNSRLGEEAKQYPPLGRMVEVNHKKLHIYTEGEGDTTLVFMAGHGTSSPTLDFMPLWMRMADEYRIAVIEKSGYGWSETSNSPRDIDTMLEETREMLERSGEKAPYVLFPHSMSGLEAIYWAQQYPEEVKAIIGLDPCTPETIDLIPQPQKVQLGFMHFISRIGLSRFMPESGIAENLPLMKSKDLSEEDKKRYLAVFYRSAVTKDMLREIYHLKDNAKSVASGEVPINTPMYFFISDDQEARANGWIEALSDYLSGVTLGKQMQLSAGHYVHYDHADMIAEEAKAFLGNC